MNDFVLKRYMTRKQSHCRRLVARFSSPLSLDSFFFPFIVRLLFAAAGQWLF